jgi:hypothetical protein
MTQFAKSMGISPLGKLTTPKKALFTSFLLTIGIGYIMALLYLFLVDFDPHLKNGMNVVEAIDMKYGGQQGRTRLEVALRGVMSDRLDTGDKQEITQWIRDGATANGYEKMKPIFEKNCVACHSTKSGLPVPPLTTFEEVLKVTQVDTGASISQLARVSHIHLFGIGIIFLLTGAIFALSGVSEKLRLTIIILPYVTIWADIGAWWITKYQPVFAYVVLIGGGFMGLALALQILISLWEMWFKNENLVLANAQRKA